MLLINSCRIDDVERLKRIIGKLPAVSKWHDCEATQDLMWSSPTGYELHIRVSRDGFQSIRLIDAVLDNYIIAEHVKLTADTRSMPIMAFKAAELFKEFNTTKVGHAES